MAMTSRLRKFVLTAHLTFSIGWLGAVAVFLAHAITGLASEQPHTVRAAYIAMELSAWLVLVPASLGALLTGIVQSVGTQWGLFKHYWIVIKLFLTTVITVLLLLHLQPISEMAEIAVKSTVDDLGHYGIRKQLLIEAALAFIVLIAIVFISVYKPWGLTPYGLKKQRKTTNSDRLSGKKNSVSLAIIALAVLVIVIIIIHLLGGGLGKH